MAELGELERAKRRRLQEAYADLRPNPNIDGDRQAKLRNLLLGSAASARPGTASSPRGSTCHTVGGAAGGGDGGAADGHQSIPAVAAAAAASINAVSGRGAAATGKPDGRRTTGALLPRRALLKGPGGSPGSAAPFPGVPGPGGYPSSSALHAPSASPSAAAPAVAHAAAHGGTLRLAGGPTASPSAFGARQRRGCGFGPEGSSAGGGGGGGSGAGGPRAPLPPGPLEGGFLHDSDPVQRLSHLPAAALAGGWVASGQVAAGAGAAAGVAGAGAGAAAGHSAGAVAYGRGGAEEETEEGDDEELDVPSDVELALISLTADLRAHPGCADMPPLALRSQLSYMLTDRSSVERQLDEQRRANRVRIFKLPTGADEFGVLTTPHYKALVLQSADAAAAAASAPAGPAEDSTAAPERPYGAYGGSTAAPAGASSTSRWHAAAQAFLRRVVNRFTEFQLSHEHLVYLLSTVEEAEPERRGELSREQRRSGQQAQWPQGGRPQQPKDQKGAAGAAKTEAVEEQISLLLHLGCIARHTDGDADAFVLAVPGAGRMVKSVVGGRKELLTWLSKRQHQEAPEEQIWKLKLRSSCLPPQFHVRDLVGRGAVKRLESTSGPMIRLPGKPGKKAG